MNNKPTDSSDPTLLDSEIDTAMTCDKGCGHTVDPETCYKHQMQKIKALIATETTKARSNELVNLLINRQRKDSIDPLAVDARIKELQEMLERL